MHFLWFCVKFGFVAILLSLFLCSLVTGLINRLVGQTRPDSWSMRFLVVLASISLAVIYCGAAQHSLNNNPTAWWWLWHTFAFVCCWFCPYFITRAMWDIEEALTLIQVAHVTKKTAGASERGDVIRARRLLATLLRDPETGALFDTADATEDQRHAFSAVDLDAAKASVWSSDDPRLKIPLFSAFARRTRLGLMGAWMGSLTYLSLAWTPLAPPSFMEPVIQWLAVGPR